MLEEHRQYRPAPKPKTKALECADRLQCIGVDVKTIEAALRALPKLKGSSLFSEQTKQLMKDDVLLALGKLGTQMESIMRGFDGGFHGQS